jgi:hypothetical protein
MPDNITMTRYAAEFVLEQIEAIQRRDSADLDSARSYLRQAIGEKGASYFSKSLPESGKTKHANLKR